MNPSIAKRIIERGKEPVWFLKNVLGGELPWKVQRQIAQSINTNQEVAIKSCHGAGKSWLAARIGLWFSATRRPSIVITTAPGDRQVRGILWKEIRVAYAGAKVPLGGRMLTQELRFDDDWWMWGFTAPSYDPNRFQGFHEANILIIVDEAAGVSSEIYEAIDGVLSSENAKLLMIGNPTDPIGKFADAFKIPEVKKFTISAFDTPNFTNFGITEEKIVDGSWRELITSRVLPYPKLVTPEWVSRRYKRWGLSSPMYQARVRAQFPKQGTNTLIPLSLVENACIRKLPTTTPIELGVDIARFGEDETVIVVRQGGHARVFSITSKEDTMMTTGKIILALEKTGAETAKVDVIGVGSGVVDRLYEQNKPVEAVNVGWAAHDPERFVNLRAEIFWNLRERLEDGSMDLDPNDDDLHAELTSIRYKVLSNGKIQVESKDEMKRRGLHSPNRADALALAFAHIDQEEEEREFTVR